MSDRKGQSKYYDPNFDYQELEKYTKQLKKTRQIKTTTQTEVRMIIPMSLQCLVCNEYIYKGTKFNSKKETVEGEEYCGIKIYRFYFKCPNCKNTFTLKTDPQHNSYVCEKNAKANIDPRRAELQRRESEMKQRKEEEKDDIVKQMENQTKNALNEMKELERLDQLKRMTRVNDSVSIDELIQLKKMKDIEKDKKCTEMKDIPTESEKDKKCTEMKDIDDTKRKRTFDQMTNGNQSRDSDGIKKKKKLSFL